MADTGFVKHLASRSPDEHFTVVGTHHFKAPEVRGDHYDSAIDIWSFGMTLKKLREYVISQEQALFLDKIIGKCLIEVAKTAFLC